MNVRPLAFALGLFALAPAAGCSRTYIPNTTVPDTSENRRIIGFCEKYRRAVEDRDVEALVSMASPRYFETGGNAKSTDDIDYNGLREYLTNRFKHTKAIRYEIKYHRIIAADATDDRTIHVDFMYTASFQIPTAQGDLWHRAVRDNRLKLLPDGDSFKIVAGM